MPTYKIIATQTNYCELEIEAESLEAAEVELKEWIEDDLLEYRVDSEWQIEVSESGDAADE